ncbi:hypothetical protein PUNSTDRAFT_140894 [Punctularia strigosozonata HHB-11173 SS5]|uniref:uncharacterized protein n=1 Tax=Punctularia strigosozonata (strain HHB-11173) TaxID=741275 RepID=UPI00044182F3|nr:uncharacterized protein PUNSTDRAFT_140894 [Punctularia strigosozonata HHB-11173 SS5]EIN14659.1 hypothetical protein PUNSTDRAFT_140894 [Punctularia strigosozonata HHB-11173 SS5]
MADNESPASSPSPTDPRDKAVADTTLVQEASAATPEKGGSDADSGSGSGSPPDADKDATNDREEASTQKNDSVEPSSSSATPAPDPGTWQAVWAPQYNAYYFYNAVTQETTWTNPLEPSASTSTSTSAPDTNAEDKGEGSSTPASTSTSMYDALQAAALAQGIDPSLAHLDPSLLAGPGGSSGAYAFQAKFNARTGAFAKTHARDPTHLSEYERAKRMSEFYFDVNQWEKDVERRKQEEEEEAGKKRKRPTKKDLERFKEQKRLKKIAKTAWLRT